MASISISNLSFTYEGSSEAVFSSLTLQLDSDWRLGLIGRNGRGKTTLLQLLTGILHPQQGTIHCQIPTDYFPFSVSQPQKTAEEVAVTVSGIDPETERWRLEREIALLELSENLLARPFDTLSGGEQTKLLLCALFLRENHFLLIDEPTNHLDLEGRQLVSRYLQKKRGFILVSHDRDFLDGCIDHVLSINRSDVELQKGNYSSWLQNRERQDQFESSENERLKRDIRRLEQSARRSAGWSEQAERGKYHSHATGGEPAFTDRGYVGHKAAKMMKRAKSIQARREKALEEKQTLLKNIELSQVGELSVSPLRHHRDKLVECRNLSIAYHGKPVFHPISFSLQQGECLVLRGKNGCGKSSLLKLLAGHPLEYTGSFQMPGGLVLSVVPQGCETVTGSLQDFARTHQLDFTKFLTILRKFGFTREQFEVQTQHYSTGQKRKVLLSASLCKPAHLYLWDEPLNYLDILSRQQLEALLVEYRPSMLLVEHDRAFCRHVATGEQILLPYPR